MTFSFSRKMRGPRALSAGVVALALVACASQPIAQSQPVTAPEIKVGESLTGNYLAARHADALNNDRDAAQYWRAALAKDPGDPMLMQRSFEAFIRDGQVSVGAAVARDLLASGEDDPDARLAVAVDDVGTGKLDEATTMLAETPHYGVIALAGPLVRAWAFAGQERYDEAIETLAPLNQIQGLATLYDLHVAWILEASGDRAKAMEHVNQALQRSQTPWLRLAELTGGLYERAGDEDRALVIYQGYQDRHPDSRLLTMAEARARAGGPPPEAITSAADGAAEAMFDISGILARQNHSDDALFIARLGLHLRPEFPALQMVTADLLQSMGRLEEANALYLAIPSDDPLAWPAHLAAARNLDSLDRTEEAETLLRRLAEENPSSAEPLIELGDMLRRHERFEEAVEAYDEAVSRLHGLEARHWRLLYVRGIALERSKVWPRAEADFLKALEFEPDQPLVLNYLGYSWVELGRNLDEAERMIRKAVELRPNDGYIVDSLGWVLYRLHRYPEAVDELERAVELRPEDPTINDHLGDAYWKVGRQREARFQWQTALALNPEPALKETIEGKLQHGLVWEANAQP